jgi:hypothetical protein
MVCLSIEKDLLKEASYGRVDGNRRIPRTEKIGETEAETQASRTS